MPSSPGLKQPFPRLNLNLSFLLGIGLAWLFLRLPLGIPMLGLCSAAVLLGQPRHTVKAPLLRAFFVTAVATSLAGGVLNGALGLNSYLVQTVCFMLFAEAVIASGDLRRNIRAASLGGFAGLLSTFIIAMFEIATGFKILPMRNPDANTAERIAEDPITTASVFANFNDFSIALALLSTFILARLAFVRSGWMHTWARWGCLIFSSFLIVYIGSRGSLGVLVLASLMVGVMIVRFARPTLVTTGRVGFLMAGLVAAFVFVWNTPYLQDNSTNTRGVIIERALDMIVGDASHLLFGFGSAGAWDAASAVVYPGALMSPHNVFLEYLIAYGVAGVALLVALIASVFVRGFIQQHVPSAWWSVVAVVTTCLIPVSGGVPSGFIDYGYSYIFPTLAYASLLLYRIEASGSAALLAAPQGVEADHAGQAQDDGESADQGQPLNAHLGGRRRRHG